MVKARRNYTCQQCGYRSLSFLGRCPNCGAWNSLVEEVEEVVSEKSKGKSRKKAVKPQRLTEIEVARIKRLSTGFGELDRVLGTSGQASGLVPGAVVLLAGDPGIGKSTLLLQTASNIASKKRQVIYISGEESAGQIKIRADRLGLNSTNLLILSETDADVILASLEREKKKTSLLIADSIQTLFTSDLRGVPGSVGQVKEVARRLTEFAKKNHLPVILVGHVTKEGTVAGPMVLEHLVDVVLFFEGERTGSLRILRSFKNRFGPTDEVGVFTMEEKGLFEVKNPSELFLEEADEVKKKPGRVVVVTLEGTRPLLVEIQALTVPSQLVMPRRVGTGVDNRRLQMLIAIIVKHLRLPLGKFDVFVNVASGLRVTEPAADLGICLAIISSFKNRSLGDKTVAIGEVGLLGEIRQVTGLTRRIKEANRLGFKRIISPPKYSHLLGAVKEVF